MARIRFLKSSSVSKNCLECFYATNPGMETECYARQIETLGNGYLELWKRELEVTGEWQVETVVVNSEGLQKRWALENGVKCAGENWLESILEHQIRHYRPEVWFCHSTAISPAFRIRMRKENPQLKVVFGHDGIDACRADHFAGCDAVVVLLENTRVYYEAHGYRSFVRPLGFETWLLDLLSPGTGQYAVSFIGGLDLSGRGHNARLELLSSVARDLPLTLFTPNTAGGIGSFRRPLGCLRRLDFGAFVRSCRQWMPLQVLHAINGGALYGLPMLQALANSRITLNCHIDAARSTAANYRLFEATGVGTCLVTDWKENLPTLFEPEREVVTYRSSAECAEKVRYLLANERERRDIAMRGQSRTLRDHTLGQSNISVMNWIRAML